jgi:hypothetical protein
VTIDDDNCKTVGGVVLFSSEGTTLRVACWNDIRQCCRVATHVSLGDPRCQIVAIEVEMIATWKSVAMDISNWVNGSPIRTCLRNKFVER